MSRFWGPLYSLLLRSLVQGLLRQTPNLTEIPRPASKDPQLLAMAASLIELLTLRRRQEPPLWVKEIGPLKEPFFLLESALSMRRLRALCETQAPEPLRKRGLYAPPNFLEFA